MSKTKFTKGEWVIHNNPKTYLITSELGFGICDTVLHDNVDKANANLIKTAPKLYAMLNNIGELANGDMNNLVEEMLCYFDDIEELLAEARGE